MSDANQRIVVGVDGSEGGREALTWALMQAARREADVEVVVRPTAGQSSEPRQRATTDSVLTTG